MTAENVLPASPRREAYLDRRVVSITPDRLEIHPARSIIFLPLLTLLLGLAAFPLIFFAGGSLSLGLRLLVTLGALILVPVSGMGLVYSIAGANIVVDRAKQSLVMQQGYMGMGVGTQELIPFWKVDSIQVQELTPHDWRGHQDDFAQYEISVVKVSGKLVSVGLVTVARAESAVGLERACEVARILAGLTGAPLTIVPQVTEPE